MDRTENYVAPAELQTLFSDNSGSFFADMQRMQMLSEQLYLDSRRYDGSKAGGEI